MKKNSFKSLATVLSLAMAATALPVNANAAAAPKISVSKASLKQAASGTVKISNIKKGYKVKFTSSNKNVIVLPNSKKTVTKKATGKTLSVKYTATSAAKIVNSGKKKATIKAVVYNAKGKKVKTLSKSVKVSPAVTSITPNMSTYNTEVGQSITVGINDLLVGSTDVSDYYTVTYKSSDESVVSNTNGGASFTALKAGTATITVTATNTANKSVTATMTVTVAAKADDQNKPNDDDNKPNDDQNKPNDDDNKPSDDTTVVSSKNFKLEVTAPADANLKEFAADPTNQVTLTVRMTDKEGLIKDPKSVAFTVFLTREVDAGGLSKSDLTLTWNGKDAWEATTTFSGTRRDTAITVPISATLRSHEGDIAIEALDQLEGLTSESKLEVTLVPNKVIGTTNTITPLEAIDVTCTSMDRLVVTFNQAPNFDAGGDFLDAYGNLAQGNGVNDKFYLNIQRSITNQDRLNNKWTFDQADGTKMVKAVLRHETDPKKAVFVLDNQYEMKDNSQFVIKYYNKVANKDNNILYSNTLDAVKPQVSRVENDETRTMTTIRVTFTKPVNMYKETEATSNPLAWQTSALNPANYIINSRRLSVSYTKDLADGKKRPDAFGTPGTIKIVPTPGHENARDSVDITLGTAIEEGVEVQRYFDPGDYILQATNIGDYAYLSDRATDQNMIATETKGFVIPKDDKKPTYKVKVQSPEQFILDFDCHLAELDTVGVGNVLPTELAGRISLLYKKLLTDPIYNNVENLGQKIRITNVTPTGQYNTRLKVEVEYDWTNLDGWKKEREDYFSYQLFAFQIGGLSFTNVSNGQKADTTQQVISSIWENKEIMQSYDGKSPEVSANGLRFLQKGDVGYVENQSTIRITFDEPVQAGNKVFMDANNFKMISSPITPAWSDKKQAEVAVPEMEVEAVNNSTKKTYKATIKGYADGIQDGLENYAIDAVFQNGDKIEQLPAGTYTVYIRAVSDDIGNTMSTQKIDITYGAPTVDTDFRVLAVLADKSYGAKRSRAISSGSIDINGNVIEEPGVLVLNNTETETVAADQGEDAIYVEFSKQYGTKVGSSVLEESKWTLNGRPLPNGSRIINGITDGEKPGGVNSYTEPKFSEVQDKLSNVGHSGITIVVPNGTITNIYNTTLTLSRDVTDSQGNILAPSSPSTFFTPTVLNSKQAVIDSIFADPNSDDGMPHRYYVTKSEGQYWYGNKE